RGTAPLRHPDHPPPLRERPALPRAVLTAGRARRRHQGRRGRVGRLRGSGKSSPDRVCSLVRVGELVLITGTSSGIGLSAAVECAAAGHRVVATMRSPDVQGALLAAAKARGVDVDVEQLDVTSPGAGAKVKELTLKYGPVYALVNNAGVFHTGAFEEQSDADVWAQFETNVFGLMAVTRAVLPSMPAAGRGRIINVSSLAG